MSEPTPILDVQNVHVIYGQSILALRGVSLSVPKGGIVALLGANGGGKTTTLKAISALLRAERGEVVQGEIHFQGKSIRDTDAASLVRQGIVQVLEGRRCFPHLSVEENLLAGGFGCGSSRRILTNDLERAYVWFPRLKARRRGAAGLLSGGEQQMLAIGRAMMTHPIMMLLDEPSMGLAPMLVEEIFEIVRRLNRDEAMSFLVAEQNTGFALRYADRAVVIENGQTVASGTTAEIAARSDLVDLYLGGVAA